MGWIFRIYLYCYCNASFAVRMTYHFLLPLMLQPEALSTNDPQSGTISGIPDNPLTDFHNQSCFAFPFSPPHRDPNGRSSRLNAPRLQVGMAREAAVMIAAVNAGSE
jgi:hypothetical protein